MDCNKTDDVYIKLESNVGIEAVKSNDINEKIFSVSSNETDCCDNYPTVYFDKSHDKLCANNATSEYSNHNVNDTYACLQNTFFVGSNDAYSECYDIYGCVSFNNSKDTTEPGEDTYDMILSNDETCTKNSTDATGASEPENNNVSAEQSDNQSPKSAKKMKTFLLIMALVIALVSGAIFVMVTQRFKLPTLQPNTTSKPIIEMSGGLADGVVPSVIPPNYMLMQKGSYRLIETNKLKDRPRRLYAVENHLWITTSTSLMIYNWRSELIQEVKFSRILFNAQAVLPTFSGNMLCADKYTGIHLLDYNGTAITTLIKGECSDLVEYLGQAYGFMWKKRSVVVLQYSSTKWRIIKHILLSAYIAGNSHDRLFVYNDLIYITPWLASSLYVYNHNGICTAKHGQLGNTHPGHLRRSTICNVDSKGTALIADKKNDRLQLCNFTGQWSVISLPDEIKDPVDAVVEDAVSGYIQGWYSSKNLSLR